MWFLPPGLLERGFSPLLLQGDLDSSAPQIVQIAYISQKPDMQLPKGLVPPIVELQAMFEQLTRKPCKKEDDAWSISPYKGGRDIFWTVQDGSIPEGRSTSDDEDENAHR